MDEFLDLGSKLKQVRESKGISLEDVQSETKIPIDILRSIERDETIRKLSPIYLKGFLKIYAKFLGVELTAEKKTYSVPSSFEPEKKTSAFKKQELKISLAKKIDYVQWIKILVTFVILLALIIFALKLSHKKKSQPLPEQETSVQKVIVSKPAKTLKSTAKLSQIKLSVRAKENTWLHVKRDGKIVFYQILRKGTSKSWIAKERFELSVGNAAAIELWFNDKIISPLGRRGQALKDVVITKDGLSAEK